MTIKLAGCVIADSKGRILLIHRSTQALRHWELPGGKVEPSESAESAAIRELKEELGVRVEIVSQIGDAGFSDQNGEFHYTWFRARIIGGSLRICEPNKFDKYDYFELNQLDKLTLSANMEKLLIKLKNREVTITL